MIKYDSDQRQRFPKNLIRLRKERGWTKSKLAQKLGWSYNTITAWERGERMPYQYAIEDMCAVFNVTETELLGSPVKLRMFAYYKKGKLTAHSNGDVARNCGSDQATSGQLAELAFQV